MSSSTRRPDLGPRLRRTLDEQPGGIRPNIRRIFEERRPPRCKHEAWVESEPSSPSDKVSRTCADCKKFLGDGFTPDPRWFSPRGERPSRKRGPIW